MLTENNFQTSRLQLEGAGRLIRSESESYRAFNRIDSELPHAEKTYERMSEELAEYRDFARNSISSA